MPILFIKRGVPGVVKKERKINIEDAIQDIRKKNQAFLKEAATLGNTSLSTLITKELPGMLFEIVKMFCEFYMKEYFGIGGVDRNLKETESKIKKEFYKLLFTFCGIKSIPKLDTHYKALMAVHNIGYKERLRSAIANTNIDIITQFQNPNPDKILASTDLQIKDAFLYFIDKFVTNEIETNQHTVSQKYMAEINRIRNEDLNLGNILFMFPLKDTDTDTGIEEDLKELDDIFNQPLEQEGGKRKVPHKYEKCTVKELKARAEKRKIKLPKNAKKAQIITCLRAH